MRLIKEIRDLEAIGKKIAKSSEKYEIRTAARAIILDSKKKVALLFVKKLDTINSLEDVWSPERASNRH